jgi:hypothetical protein
MPVMNRLKALLLCGDSRLGDKADISTLSPAILSCIYSMPPSYELCWKLSCGELQNPAHGLLVPHVFTRWHACLHTQYLLQVAEVRWKRGGQSHGAANTELSDVFAGNRCSSSKIYLSLCRGAIQDSTHIH